MEFVFDQWKLHKQKTPILLRCRNISWDFAGMMGFVFFKDDLP
jgi:hypothetical protein